MNLREPPIRSAKYLRGSKDETCKLRIVCDGYGDNVVPCHARDRHTGRGQKASDLSVIDGCQACHDIFDMRAKLPSGQFLTSEEWLFYALRGLQDTIESRARRQIIIVPLDPEHLSSSKPTPARKPKPDRSPVAASRPMAGTKRSGLRKRMNGKVEPREDNSSNRKAGT